MTLKQIEYFRVVCQKGNISAAAESLYVSRSVISRAMAELEEEFGTRIFTRSKNGVVLTESGQILSRLFEEFSESYDTTREWIRQLQDHAQTPILRLGITPTNAYRVYQLHLHAFEQTHPEICLHVNEYSAYDAWKLLLNGTVDAFFTPARPLDRNMFGMLDIYQTQIVLGMENHDPLAGKSSLGIFDILDLPLGYLNAPMPLDTILDSCFAAFGKKPNVVLRTSDQLLLRDLTLEGTIYSLLPGDTLEFWEGVSGVPLDFFHPSVNRLVWSSALPHGEAFNIFLDFMRQNALKPADMK